MRGRKEGAPASGGRVDVGSGGGACPPAHPVFQLICHSTGQRWPGSLSTGPPCPYKPEVTHPHHACPSSLQPPHMCSLGSAMGLLLPSLLPPLPHHPSELEPAPEHQPHRPQPAWCGARPSSRAPRGPLSTVTRPCCWLRSLALRSPLPSLPLSPQLTLASWRLVSPFQSCLDTKSG